MMCHSLVVIVCMFALHLNDKRVRKASPCCGHNNMVIPTMQKRSFLVFSLLLLGLFVTDALVSNNRGRGSNTNTNTNTNTPRGVTSPSASLFLRPGPRRIFSHPLVLGASSTIRDDDDDDPEETSFTFGSCQRRHFLGSLPLIALLLQKPPAASAKGLVTFPCDYPLVNKYHLMRAGTSLLEEQGIWSTTTREISLSASGQEQIRAASQQLQSVTTMPTVVKHSLAASCTDTVRIIGDELHMGRDQLVPEITFLDARGVGKWDMQNRTDTQSAVWAMDVDEAGPYGRGARPPASDDGTPYDTLADQAIRLRQVMSNLEAQYSRDTILLIFPDGTGPALLSAMMAGIPYNQVHELEFAPGELRLDVTYESILALWKTKQNDPKYAKVLKQGRTKLANLRSVETERLAMEQAFQETQMKRQQEEEVERQRQLQERQEEILANKNQETTTSPGVLAAVGVSVVAGGLWMGMTSQDNNDNMVTDDLSKLLSPTGTHSNTTSLDDMTSLSNEDRSSSLSSLIPPRAKISSVSSPPNMWPTSDSGISLPTGTISIKDKDELAQEAMEEYMERDDGGNSWLNAIAEIREEDEED